MKRTLIFCAALTLSVLSMVASPTTQSTRADAPTCEDCQADVQRKFEQCQAVHGINYQRCYDDFNEGIVRCFRKYCEQ